MNTRLQQVYGPPPPPRRTPENAEPTMGEAWGGQYGLTPTPLHAVDAQMTPAQDAKEKAEVMPLPGWLLKIYFVFPVILYIPDAIFNYYVYSDGVSTPQGDNVILVASQVALWGFLSVGIVGMAYLLSMLAPWHWSQGHRIQAFFCGIGVLIATAITTWNSLAFRSTNFQPFKTDLWAYSIWPQLTGIGITMIIAAVAPPFWGLFWAIVQPTQSRRNLSHLQGSHQERMLKLQQDAELKALRAEANAAVRAAQIKGMAATATAAREQAGAVASQWRGKPDGKALANVPNVTPVVAVAPAPPVSPTPPPPPQRSGGNLNGSVIRLPPLAGASALPTPPVRRGSRARPDASLPTPSTDAPVDGRRGSLDHVRQPGDQLPVQRVTRA